MQRIQCDPRRIADAAEHLHLRHRAGIGVDAIKDNPLSRRRVSANVGQSFCRAALSESALGRRCRGNGAGDSGTTDHHSTACDRDNVCHVRSLSFPLSFSFDESGRRISQRLERDPSRRKGRTAYPERLHPSRWRARRRRRRCGRALGSIELVELRGFELMAIRRCYTPTCGSETSLFNALARMRSARRAECSD